MKKIICAFVCLSLASCIQIPPNTFIVTPELLKQRQLESRRYDGQDETAILSASANVIQDLGFTLENSETKLGVITASKQRDATDGGEIAAAIFVALLGGGAMAISKDQTIRASLVVRAVLDSNGVATKESHIVRITFQRIVRRTDNSVYAQTLKDPELYQGFFEKLSKSVFIEGQHI